MSEFSSGWADDALEAQAVMGETASEGTLTLRGVAIAGVISPIEQTSVQGPGGRRSINTFDVFLTREVADTVSPSKGDTVVARNLKARIGAMDDMAEAGVKLECAAFHGRSSY